MEKRKKVLMVSKIMVQKREEDLERITSEYGIMLRMNRSIQAGRTGNPVSVMLKKEERKIK